MVLSTGSNNSDPPSSLTLHHMDFHYHFPPSSTRSNRYTSYTRRYNITSKISMCTRSSVKFQIRPEKLMSVRQHGLYVCRLSVTSMPLLKLFDGFRCYLAGTVARFNEILC